MLWATGLWLVLLIIYGAVAYFKSSDTPYDYTRFSGDLEKALKKNGYQVIKEKKNHIQFKKKEWAGTYYVDLDNNNRPPKRRQNIKCKISFYPRDRKKRSDRWQFIWDTLSNNPKLVGVINYIAKTFTKNQIRGINVQNGISKKLEQDKSKSPLILKSDNGKYFFRLKPFPSKVVCEFVAVREGLPGDGPFRRIKRRAGNN